jgi:hypothetical protein
MKTEHDMVSFLLILVALSPVVFIIGLVKPKWILFWMKEPDRLWASSVGLFLLMGSFTAWSELRMPHRPEGQREHQQERPVEQQNELQLDRLK